ncbi:cytochrome c [Pollutimonas harenae]|uniref:Cytochrome c n=1 Tax=Pollutimonas harenae TaxID=657015 RepID=A0A853GW45_9BURK|nr:cytochrome c [Pollutimonas harenae]NYT84362.1 cytochrome c [Pollutimonas harenae]TEA73237.1 c-type cytochrome [Pollutimonas harenae]
MKVTTIAGTVVVLALVVGGVVLSGVLEPDYDTSAVDEQVNAPDQQLLARGKYLARAGDCTACHTSKDGAPFAGGVPIPTPFGTIYGTNITPDPEYGIGQWTSADFYKVLHDGIAPGGPLYPAMPYTSYRGLSREDSDAIFAYLRSIEPAPVPNRAIEIPFPFNFRPLMRGWNLLFLTDTLPSASEGSSEEWVRGRYLVNVLGHCTECHTPRGMLGQLKLGESFEGGAAEAIHAPDLTPGAMAARGWAAKDLQQFLAQGIAPQGSAYGGMYDAFHHSTRYLSEADNKAVVRYLTGDTPHEAVTLKPATPEQDETVKVGRSHYLALCAGCHAANGQGKPNVTVALAGNSTIRNPDPNNLLQVVLHGLDQKEFPGNQGRQAMPGFADALDNAQVAELANYLRVSFGGQKGDVTGDAVAKRR